MGIDSFNEALHPSPGRGTSSLAREVFILGAGFSKQISRHMPLLKELSEAISVRVPELGKIGPVPFLRTDVEMAMTFLSQPQPWLSDAQRLRHRALFLEITRAIAAEIEEDRSATVRACPGWLLKFVHWLHFRKAVVIVLN